ncbi:uncharacterized protein [Prorops nasuta]|uniref:uncharacterized protein n=1 Tax=Prorops nasuta TaxID=863751 RepID=UPI0034CD291D
MSPKDETNRLLSDRNLETVQLLYMAVPGIICTWSSLKALYIAILMLNLAGCIVVIISIIWAFKIDRGLSAHLNLVVPGDGHLWPAVIITTSLTCAPVYILGIRTCVRIRAEALTDPGDSNDSKLSEQINRALFIHSLLCFLSGCLIIAANTAIILYSATFQKKARDGLTEAIGNYATDLSAKARLDVLQIEFRCCGSDSYRDWFRVPWLRDSEDSIETLDRDSDNDRRGRKRDLVSNADVPFSCCSTDVLTTCIHYDILKPNSNYNYNPESRLTIATAGCRSKVVGRAREVGYALIAFLTVLAIYQIILSIFGRLLQTAYSNDFYIGPRKDEYRLWILGKTPGGSNTKYNRFGGNESLSKSPSFSSINAGEQLKDEEEDREDDVIEGNRDDDKINLLRKICSNLALEGTRSLPLFVSRQFLLDKRGSSDGNFSGDIVKHGKSEESLRIKRNKVDRGVRYSRIEPKKSGRKPRINYGENSSENRSELWTGNKERLTKEVDLFLNERERGGHGGTRSEDKITREDRTEGSAENETIIFQRDSGKFVRKDPPPRPPPMDDAPHSRRVASRSEQFSELESSGKNWKVDKNYAALGGKEKRSEEERLSGGGERRYFFQAQTFFDKYRCGRSDERMRSGSLVEVDEGCDSDNEGGWRGREMKAAKECYFWRENKGRSTGRVLSKFNPADAYGRFRGTFQDTVTRRENKWRDRCRRRNISRPAARIYSPGVERSSNYSRREQQIVEKLQTSRNDHSPSPPALFTGIAGVFPPPPPPPPLPHFINLDGGKSVLENVIAQRRRFVTRTLFFDRRGSLERSRSLFGARRLTLSPFLHDFHKDY